jgi:hypothetical protein
MSFLVSGASAIASSLFLPNRREVLETAGGILFVGGLCVVGAGLPMLR